MTPQTLESCKSFIECQIHEHRNVVSRWGGKSFVTISRQAGAGGITIGRILGNILREHDKRGRCGCPWTVFDRDLVAETLKEHNLSRRLEAFMSEDKESEVQDTLEELFGLHPARWILVRKTSQTILRLAQEGRVILVGRGANVLTRKLVGGFHVRLVGSYAKRLEHMRSYYGLNAGQAEALIKKEDAGRKSYLKKYFSQDIDDPLLYDLVINTDAVSYEDAARHIAQGVTRRSMACKEES